MTNGEAKMLETDAIIFPMNSGEENQKLNLAEDAANKIIVEEKSVNIDIETRFARLKKSLRKRSVSIL